MSAKQMIVKAAMSALTQLASNPEAQEKAMGALRSAYDVYQVRTGKVNLQSAEEAIKSAVNSCIRSDAESQAKIAAFVSALYVEHDIHRGAQVGGSLRKRFGTAWFPHIKEKEERYALQVNKELEDYLYQDIQAKA